MKWDRVKKKTASMVYTHILEGHSFETMAVILLDGVAQNKPVSKKDFYVYADKAYEIIMNWDIRCAGKLRDTFPWAFPTSLCKPGQFCAGIDDESGDWELWLE